MNEERSEVYCTNCTGRFIAVLDLSLNGNHEITCPLCQHIHYRVVRNGVVTEDRWQSSAGPTYQVTTITLASNYTSSATTTTGVTFLSSSWLQTVTT